MMLRERRSFDLSGRKSVKRDEIAEISTMVNRIDWPLQRSTLRYLRSHGSFPDLHYSHDALNEEVAVPISDQLQLEWTTTFQELLPRIQREEEGMVFVLADGFLMLCDEESVEEFDLRILVREQYDVLKQRRDKRSGYVRRSRSSNGGMMADDFGDFVRIDDR